MSMLLHLVLFLPQHLLTISPPDNTTTSLPNPLVSHNMTTIDVTPPLVPILTSLLPPRKTVSSISLNLLTISISSTTKMDSTYTNTYQKKPVSLSGVTHCIRD